MNRLPRIPAARVALLAAVALGAVSVADGMVLGGRSAVAGASGFLCPSSGRLISIGQVTEEVRRRCREPDDIQKRLDLRTVRETTRRWTNGIAQDVTVERTVEVPIEEWFFDFGPTRFTKVLRFEAGRLVYVEEGAKGTPGGG